MRNIKIKNMIIAALLCAIGIIIPMYSPLKILLEPASFTLGSHIAVFMAMLISPSVAAAVALGTTLGFFLGGFPIVIVMRAATHIVFALTGALILKSRPEIMESAKKSQFFSFLIGILHGVCEVVIVTPFYFSNSMTEGYYARGFVISVILLVGVGSVVHSMVDFILTQLIWRPIKKSKVL